MILISFSVSSKVSDFCLKAEDFNKKYATQMDKKTVDTLVQGDVAHTDGDYKFFTVSGWDKATVSAILVDNQKEEEKQAALASEIENFKKVSKVANTSAFIACAYTDDQVILISTFVPVPMTDADVNNFRTKNKELKARLTMYADLATAVAGVNKAGLTETNFNGSKLFTSGDKTLKLNLITLHHLTSKDALKEQETQNFYTSPETQKDKKISSASNVYSFAMNALALEFGLDTVTETFGADTLKDKSKEENVKKINEGVEKLFKQDDFNCSKPGFFSRLWNWFLGLFCDRSVQKTTTYTDLFQKMLSVDASKRGKMAALRDQLETLNARRTGKKEEKKEDKKDKKDGKKEDKKEKKEEVPAEKKEEVPADKKDEQPAEKKKTVPEPEEEQPEEEQPVEEPVDQPVEKKTHVGDVVATKEELDELNKLAEEAEEKNSMVQQPGVQQQDSKVVLDDQRILL